MKKVYNSPFEFANDFQLSYKNYWNQANNIDQQIERLKKIKEELFYPRLHEQLNWLAEAVKTKLKADEYEISKHGGLSNRCTIYFMKGKPKDEELGHYSNVIGSITFAEYRDGVLTICPASQDDEVIDITQETTIQELAKIAKENK